MAIGKKALVFSLISILMSTLFIIMFSSLVHVPLDSKSKIDIVDIERVDNFLEIFPEYLGTAIEHTSYEVLPYLINKSPLEGNFSDAFLNCSLYGTINSSTEENCSLSGNRTTLDEIVDEIANLASDIYRGTCVIQITFLNVSQNDPYELSIDSKAELFFEKENKLIINRRYEITQKVSLIGLTEPFRKEIDQNEIKFGENQYFSKKEFHGNLSLIKDYIDKGYLFVDVSAPSFIDILEGRLIPDDFDGNLEPDEFDPLKQLGLNSFIPSVYPNGTHTYKENRSFLSWD